MSERQRWVKPVLITLGVLVGGIVLACAAFNTLLGDLCGYEDLRRVSSPDGRYDAVLVEVNCGATTDYAYWVCVVPSGGKDYRNPVFVSAGERAKEIEFGWKDGKLEISLPKSYQEFKRLSVADIVWGNRVEVIYRVQE